MTRYQRVLWQHELANEPIVLYSEVGDDGMETRKVDQYRDGRLDYADPDHSTGSTFLSVEAMPTIAEIAAQAEFTPLAITRDEFEEVWRRAIGRDARRR
jgi:hypothetical protein